MKRVLVAVVIAGWGGACGGGSKLDPPPFPTDREPCTDHDPLRRALFGDLHVHTRFSFDAAAYGNVLDPADAYAFGKGEAVMLPPLDADGNPTRAVQLSRPLDFLAVTDHSEFLGEVFQCTTPGSPGYDSTTCNIYRDPDLSGPTELAIRLSVTGAGRFEDICGADGERCLESAKTRWWAVQVAAEDAYDRTSACTFTSFVGYEYTNTTGVSNLHRNVVFKNTIVPKLPVSHFEAVYPSELWRELDKECVSAGTGCDVVLLPHNSNLSNGNLFYVQYPPDATPDERRELAELRARFEPVAEIFQHKGDSECRNGFPGVNADPDPLCAFEKLRPADDEVCGDPPGSGGMRLGGCVHRLDFLRNVLAEGLLEQSRNGVNPYRLGFIGSTDTHNATPGMVDETSFPGHVGVVDATPEDRLGYGNITHDGIINNPGGLAGVWAEENSRPSIFAAIKRRETFATSGPRIKVRFFAGWNFDANVCDGSYEQVVQTGYDDGVTMGSVLSGPGTSLSFVIHAQADELPLERIQVIKGWLGSDGKAYEKVFDVATTGAGPSVDENTCVPMGSGWQSHCVVWTDPEFDPSQPSFYYTRVVQNPTCRWSTLQCNEFDPLNRPAGCDDPNVAKVIQERAWSSPIWYVP